MDSADTREAGELRPGPGVALTGSGMAFCFLSRGSAATGAGPLAAAGRGASLRRGYSLLHPGQGGLWADCLRTRLRAWSRLPAYAAVRPLPRATRSCAVMAVPSWRPCRWWPCWAGTTSRALRTSTHRQLQLFLAGCGACSSPPLAESIRKSADFAKASSWRHAMWCAWKPRAAPPWFIAAAERHHRSSRSEVWGVNGTPRCCRGIFPT